MQTAIRYEDRSKAMVSELVKWANETAAVVFRAPNLRGDLTLHFDTSSGVVRPQLHASDSAPPLIP